MKPILILFLFLSCVACGKIDSFEKNVAIPGHAWASDFIPEISVKISDTAAVYDLFVVLRHTNAYRWNNLWINLYTQTPSDTARFNKQRFDIRLATDSKGWIGSGMDDIYEHRSLITTVRFPQPGTYTFRIEQLMREDPLEHILNAGIRIQKVQ